MFHNNIVTVSEILNKWNMLKTCIQTAYPSIFCYERKENSNFFFKPETRIKLFVQM